MYSLLINSRKGNNKAGHRGERILRGTKEQDLIDVCPLKILAFTVKIQKPLEDFIQSNDVF